MATGPDGATLDSDKFRNLPGVRSAWPLVGRDEEVEFVVEGLQGGDHAAVVVGGSAGVGKSRLARETAARLASVGWEVERLGATPASSVLPFGTFARLLVVPTTTGGVAPAGAAQTIQATVAALRARTSTGPVLLVIDDAQHLDPFSALLVHQLASDGKVRQLLTIRSGDAAPDPVPSLWKDGLAERLDLQPLSREETAALLHSVLGGPVARTSVAALWEATTGLPLLLHEVVLDAVGSGSLQNIHGVWQWRPNQDHGPRLRDAVAARLGDLTVEERHAVEVVALSEPLGVADLARVAPGVDLVHLERRSVLRVESDGLRRTVRLWHPILADVVRGQLGMASRRELAAELAAALGDSGGRRRGDLFRVSLLQLDAGDGSHVDELADAAMEANVLPDHPLAERLARASYATRATWRSALALGEALVLQSKFPDAEPVLRRALELAEGDATRARVGWDLHSVCQSLGRPDEAAATLDLASSKMSDESWRQVVDGDRIQQAFSVGRIREARERGEALLAVAADGKVRLRLVTSLVPARALAGRTADALELVASVVPDAFAHQAVLPLGVTWAFISRAVALLLGGDLKQAATHVQVARAAADSLVRNDSFSVLGLFEGRLALACGDASAAAAVLREVAGQLRVMDSQNSLHWTLALLAEAEALRGDQESAELAATEANERRGWPGTYDSDAARALAWVLALGGRRTQAVERLREIADHQAGQGQEALEVHTRHDAYRLGDRSQAAAVLELSSTIDGMWSDSLSLHVRAAEAADPELLDQSSKAFEEQGAALLAAEASIEAATAFRAAGLKSRAAAATHRASAMREGCGPVGTPILLDADGPVDLTRREREVVELAARGLSNAEIAATLFVSVRTAEGHLLRAFTKMGVSDRASLKLSRA